ATSWGCPRRTCVALWTSPRQIRECSCTAPDRRCVRDSRTTTPMPDFFNRLFGRRGNGGGPPGGLACQELVELVTDYLEGALSDTDRERFEAHIAACGHCTAYVEQMRRTVELTGKVTTQSLSPESERELLAAFRDWKAGA